MLLAALLLAAPLASQAAAEAPAPRPAPPAKAVVADVSEAKLQVDDKRGEPVVVFRADGLKALNLGGKKVTYSLWVKRKLAEWKSARNYPIGEVWITRPSQTLPTVSLPLYYATLARDRFLPGEHDAAIVATIDDGAVEVMREHVTFLLPGTGELAFQPRLRR